MSALAMGLIVVALAAAIESFRRLRPRDVLARGAADGRLAVRAAAVRTRTVAERSSARSAWPGGPRALVTTATVGPSCAAVAGWLVGGGVAMVAGLLLAGGALVAAVRTRAARRLDAVAAQVPLLCERMSSAIRAGRSLRAALERAAGDAPEPARTELRVLAGDLALGARVEDALRNATARVPIRELAAVTATIDVQRRAGGSLVRALDGLADRLRERQRLVAEVRAATAQARATAWIVGAIPLVGALAVELSAPGTLLGIFGTGVGPALVAVAAVLFAVAMVAVIRIARVET